MHIGINLLYLIPGKSGGTETYVRNVVRRLVRQDAENSYSMYVSQEAYRAFSEFEGRVNIVRISNIHGNKLFRILYEQLVFPARVTQDRIDVLFSPGYVVPVLASCVHVVTVHDMLYKRYPGTIPLVKRLYWSIFIPLSFRRSSIIIAVSEFVKKEFETYFPEQKAKFIVSHESVDKELFYQETPSQQIRDTYGLPARYMVCVATLSPHKNLESVLKAVDLLKQRKVIVNVVFVGNKERSTKYLNSMIRVCGLEQQVFFTGFVPDNDLRSIYCNAELFVMPSMYEGFGLPVLESMACGCPVVSSTAGSLIEITGEAAELFSPGDPAQLAEKIGSIYFDTRRQDELRQKGFANVAKYEWDATAAKTLDAFKSAWKR